MWTEGVKSYSQILRRYDTLNLFEYDYFSGREAYYYSDIPDARAVYNVNSIIVTGCQPWTLYE